MNEKEMIDEVKKLYEAIMEEECTDEIAQKTLDDFNRHFDIWERIDKTSHPLIKMDEEISLPRYLKKKKRMKLQKKFMEEERVKMMAMKPIDRLFYREMMNDKVGELLRPFLDTDEGKKLMEDIDIMSEEGDGAIPYIQTIFSAISKAYPEEFKQCLICDCVNQHGTELAGWFRHISCDGERIIRTIYQCCKCLYAFGKEKNSN